MNSTLCAALASAGIAFVASPALAQGSVTPDPHHTGVNERGDHVMGFDHAKTTHHFRLTPSGGAIEVTVNDAVDTESRDAIRSHLVHIARMFEEGNFEAPMLIHDREAPGVTTLKERKNRIRWTYEDMATGGRIRIASKDAKAVAAIHDFLRFQIEDHRTGDSRRLRFARGPG
jgi:hypothetical protein